jgi:hypothetical protein
VAFNPLPGGYLIKGALCGGCKFKKTTRKKSIWPNAALNRHFKIEASAGLDNAASASLKK